MNAFGLDLADIGINETHGTGAAPQVAVPAEPDHSTLVVGSPLSRALYSVWSGNLVTVCPSPPGAGKTTLVADVVRQLVERSDFKIILAAVTRRSLHDLATRIHKELGPDASGNSRLGWGISTMPPPEGISTSGNLDEYQAVVRTLASLSTSKEPTACDLLIVDEAWQAKYSDLVVAADASTQLLLVGDPGQIPPIVTANVSYLESGGAKRNPHHAAPDVLKQTDGAMVIPLESSYRLGQETVDVIAPLYNFPFDSRRPDRHLRDRRGMRLDEIDPLEVAAGDRPDHMPTMELIADLAISRIGCMLHEGDQVRALEAEDVGIVVAHNSQSGLISALLDSRGVVGISVGTADKMQGGQWSAVISLDPLFGHEQAGAHQTSPGRLCVMLSRHMTQLTWVHSNDWQELLEPLVVDRDMDALRGQKIRRNIIF